MAGAVRQRLDTLLARRAPAVRCTACGAVLFRTVPAVSRGQVKLPGADNALVAVDFDTTTRLGFRHADLSECRRAGGAP